MSNPQTLMVRDADTGAMMEIDFAKNTRKMRDESGKLVEMDLGMPDVHIDAPLATYAAGYKQAPGVADIVAPIIPSDKPSNKFYTWDKDDVFQDAEDLIVGPGGAVKEISPRLSVGSFSTVPYGVGSFIPTEVAAAADTPLQPERAAVARCLNVLRLARERRVAALVATSGNWTGGYVQAAAAKWNGGAGSNPVQDIYSLVETSLTEVRALVMSPVVWHDFVQNAQVQKYTAAKTMTPSIATQEQASAYTAILGLPPIIIATMKGKTQTGYGYVWGNSVVAVYNDPGMPNDGQSISTAYTFRFMGGSAPDGTLQGGFLVRSYFDPKRGARGGRMVVVVHNDAEVMTSVYAGGLITGAHA